MVLEIFVVDKSIDTAVHLKPLNIRVKEVYTQIVTVV